jgi:sulfur carrier protein
MQIYLNGEEQEIPDGINVASLIKLLELSGRRIAVEVNEELVPRSTFEEQQLQPRDRIEIVHAIGGG